MTHTEHFFIFNDIAELCADYYASVGRCTACLAEFYSLKDRMENDVMYYDIADGLQLCCWNWRQR